MPAEIRLREIQRPTEGLLSICKNRGPVRQFSWELKREKLQPSRADHLHDPEIIPCKWRCTLCWESWKWLVNCMWSGDIPIAWQILWIVHLQVSLALGRKSHSITWLRHIFEDPALSPVTEQSWNDGPRASVSVIRVLLLVINFHGRLFTKEQGSAGRPRPMLATICLQFQSALWLSAAPVVCSDPVSAQLDPVSPPAQSLTRLSSWLGKDGKCMLRGHRGA